MKLEKILESDNLANDLKEDRLIDIGNSVVEGFDIDLQSRKPWEVDIERWTKLALQISQEKTFPWRGASNVKYPLLATACMQFAARAYPSLVPSDGQIVKCKTIGYDSTGEKAIRAERISKHMSYQIMYEMDSWEEEMDKLLLTLPIVGTIFKKSYWDSVKQKNHSCLVWPRNLVVNYWASSLEEAERVTEWFALSKRKLKERQLQKIYKEEELGDPSNVVGQENTVLSSSQVMADDTETKPYIILEQHTYLDLDEDGYKEPYVVTVEYGTRKVLRIVPRFSAKEVMVNDSNTVVAIRPIEYYTKYSFIPNPDGGFYDIGFGRLLGTINDSVDTIINQLIDAGTLNNLQAGFIGKGLRIKMGEANFRPGEWKAVNATGDDLKKQILPLPVNPPNQVLLDLLQYLVQSGRDLASVAEIFVGKMPGQNTPATTTMASIEQGMKVFTAVYKRIFRSLTKEFRKLYKLNADYLNPETVVSILDQPVQQAEYEGDPNDIFPAADPAAVSNQEKQQKAQVLMQLIGLGTINPMAVTQYVLEAHEIPQPEKFLMEPQPQQDPKMQEMQMKAQLEQQKAQMKMEMDKVKMQMQLAEGAQKMELEKKAKEMELQFKYLEHMLDSRVAAHQAQQSLQQSEIDHAMSLRRSEEVHKQQISQKPKEGSK